jgi:hypothetical protein
MASPAQLVATVSRATGVPLPTVVDIDRKLAKAGLRTMSGRGRSAARMTAGDGARLLTAILASAQATEAANAVQRYMATTLDKRRSTHDLTTLAGKVFSSLRARHGFVDALEALIVSAMHAEQTASRTKGRSPSIEVFAFTRATYGRVRVSGLADRSTVVAEYLPEAKARLSSNSGSDGPGDLEQSRRITGRTILAVAELLAEEK